MSVHFVVLPVAVVLRSVHAGINAAAMSFVVQPFAFIDVSVGMLQPALPIYLVVLPLPEIFAAICKQLFALTFALSMEHFARVEVVFYFEKFCK